MRPGRTGRRWRHSPECKGDVGVIWLRLHGRRLCPECRSIWLVLAHCETFFAAIFAVDVFLPIVNLGQESAGAATTTTTCGIALRIFTFAYQVAGWMVTSRGLAAITVFVQRGSPD